MATKKEWDALKRAIWAKPVRESIRTVGERKYAREGEGPYAFMASADTDASRASYSGDAEEAGKGFWRAIHHLKDAAKELDYVEGMDQDDKDKIYSAIDNRLLRVGKKIVRNSILGKEKKKDLYTELSRAKREAELFQVHSQNRGVKDLVGRTTYLPAVLVFVGFLASLFFFSFNFTGNVIASNMAHDGNILGIVFFLIGLVGTLLYFRKRK